MTFAYKHLSLISIVVTATLVLACTPSGDDGASVGNKNSIIKIDGSSTVFPITEAVSEEFQIATKTKVTVGISGTGGGFKKFCRGETDVQNASRPILEKEMAACKEAGIEFVELPIAFDALTVVVHPNNDFIKHMTVAELNKIWAPEAQQTINTWNQVNPAWPDAPLKLFGAGSDSGTFDYFTEAIVGKAKSSRGDFTASEDDNVLVQGVINDKGALGYFGFAYYEENKDKIRAVAIALDEKSHAVLPSKESVMDGTYQPLSRPLFIYVSAKSAKEKPEVKAFIDAYLRDAQVLTEEVKFIPLPEKDMAAVKAHWVAMKTGTGFGGRPEVGIKIEDLLARIK
ncbi:MAG: protein sphX [Methylophilales bacterium 28-44-11]|nr:MAG: protein sphX [Methylophilales bacterium 28-44-11]